MMVDDKNIWCQFKSTIQNNKNTNLHNWILILVCYTLELHYRFQRRFKLKTIFELKTSLRVK